MKFLTLGMIASLVPLSQASANFQATVSTVNNQMTALQSSINKLKAVAVKNGHRRISAKCDDALQHLAGAKYSWGGISSGFYSFPWQAASSPHAGNVQSRMASCGQALDWIYAQPEMDDFPAYDAPVGRCQTTYDGCQRGCQSVWDWPSPPDYRPPYSGYGPSPTDGYGPPPTDCYGPTPPRPSQAAHGGYNRRHKRQTTLCPAQETACPITAHTSGIECIDTQTELTSCGGCVVNGEGENCLAIIGADAVGCDQGSCVVFSVKSGFSLSNITARPELTKSVKRSEQTILS